MTHLIHLNGLPGSGKSTIARHIVGVRPLALNLDVDLLRRSLGLWQRSPTESGLQARRLAIAVIRVHLRDGFDVVVPQFLGRHDFLRDLEEVAAETGAAFHEVVLRAPLETLKSRFNERSAVGAEPQHVEAAQMLDGTPDAAFDSMNRDPGSFLRGRADVIDIDTGTFSPEQSCLTLSRILGWASR